MSRLLSFAVLLQGEADVACSILMARRVVLVDDVLAVYLPGRSSKRLNLNGTTDSFRDLDCF